jgi:hypothetical protein
VTGKEKSNVNVLGTCTVLTRFDISAVLFVCFLCDLSKS